MTDRDDDQRRDSPDAARMFDLTGRVAVVTGASSGLGARFCRVLATAGARVVAAARRLDRLEGLAAADELVAPHRCDVSNRAHRAALIERTIAEHGRIDVLVNAAGITSVAPAERFDFDEYRATMTVNADAVLELSQLAARSMLDAGSGAIVNVASIFGLVGAAPIDQVAYSTSKGAVINMTRHLASEWASRGVRVNALVPGFFATEMTARLLSDERSREWLMRNTPARRLGDPWDLDGPLLLLASDAGRYINGAVLAVDGGWTAR